MNNHIPLREMITLKSAKTQAGTKARRKFIRTAQDREQAQEYCVYSLGSNYYFLTKIRRDGALWYLGGIETESKKGILLSKTDYFKVIEDSHHQMIQKMRNA